MKHCITLLFILIGLSVSYYSVAQNTDVIGKAKSYIDTKYIPVTDYTLDDTIEEQGFEKYMYNNHKTDRSDIKKTLVIFYKDDICTHSQTLTDYDNLKFVLNYMDNRYNKVAKYCWITADNRYIMVVTPSPRDNSVKVITTLKEN